MAAAFRMRKLMKDILVGLANNQRKIKNKPTDINDLRNYKCFLNVGAAVAGF